MITFLPQRPQVGTTYEFTEAIADRAFSGKEFTAVCQRFVNRKQWQGASGLKYTDEYWEFARSDTGECFVTAVEALAALRT